MTKKTIKGVSADVGLMAVAFNLCRIFNILTPEVLKNYLKMLFFVFGTFIKDFKPLYQTCFGYFKVARPTEGFCHRPV